MAESQTTLAGSTGPLETWIDRMRYRVAAELGVDPDTLEHELVQARYEDGQPYIDVRFKSK